MEGREEALIVAVMLNDGCVDCTVVLWSAGSMSLENRSSTSSLISLGRASSSTESAFVLVGAAIVAAAAAAEFAEAKCEPNTVAGLSRALLKVEWFKGSAMPKEVAFLIETASGLGGLCSTETVTIDGSVTCEPSAMVNVG